MAANDEPNGNEYQRIGIRPPDEPSEWVQDMQHVVASLDRDVLTGICELLGPSLVHPTSSLERQQLLGLLIRIVCDDATAEWIPKRRYNAERAVAAKRGEIWPEASTLAEGFGGWQRALKAAMDIAFRPDSRESTTNRHATGHVGAYSRDECIQAVIRCALDLGYWPTANEYSTWASLRRRMHAQSKRGGDQRIPSLRPFTRKFGGFDAVKRDAMEAARSAAQE
jgi:hypothetical protein